MISIVTVAALVAANLFTIPDAAVVPGAHLPAAFAQGDAADSLWRAGRRAVADEDWDSAVRTFASVRSRFPRSAYVGDSYYWQAWALYQKGGNAGYRQAVDLLTTQRQSHGTAGTVRSGEAQRLITRIRGALAQVGDEAAAAEIARRATTAVGASPRTPATSRSSASSRASSSAGSACPNEEDDDRVMALNALLQMRSDDALPLLKQVLARRDACSESLRRKAVFLVSQKRSADAADILMDAAQNDPDAETREQAVFWLSQVSTERATTLLEQILKTSKDEALQDKALFALSQGSSNRGQVVLRDYASREDAPAHLREQAVFWIGQRASEDNAQFLRGLFGRTTNGELKEKILFSLSQQRSAGNDQFLLDQAVNPANSVEVRKQALFWAGQSGAADVGKMAALYDKGTDQEFREQVIFVLSQRSKSPEALDKLISIARNDPNRDLRQKAIFWLGQSRDPKALKALTDIALKPPTQE